MSRRTVYVYAFRCVYARARGAKFYSVEICVRVFGGKIDCFGGKIDCFGGKIDCFGGKIGCFGGKID